MDFRYHPQKPERSQRYSLITIIILVFLGFGAYMLAPSSNLEPTVSLEKSDSSSFLLFEKHLTASILDPKFEMTLPEPVFAESSEQTLSKGLSAFRRLQRVVQDDALPSLEKIEKAKQEANLIVEAWGKASDASLPLLKETQNNMEKIRNTCALFLKYADQLRLLLGKDTIQRWLIAFPHRDNQENSIGIELLFDGGNVISKKIITFSLLEALKTESLKNYWQKTFHNSLDFAIIVSQDALERFLYLNDINPTFDINLSSEMPSNDFYSQILEYLRQSLKDPKKLFDAVDQISPLLLRSQ